MALRHDSRKHEYMNALQAPLWRYLNDEERRYVLRGFETDQDDPPVILRRRVPIDAFAVNEQSLERARYDSRRGAGSHTDAPVSLRYDPDYDIFFLVDGHHRLAEAIERGEDVIDVAIVGSGYSDYWATPR